jgi:hypothetical protein
MKKVFRLIAFALVFAASASRAQSFNAFTGPFNFDFKTLAGADARILAEVVKPFANFYKSKEFVMSKFDDAILKTFNHAWRSSGNGVTPRERVVLILRMTNGNYQARLQSPTNEYKSCSFAWHPATVAIVHTHPNSSDPRPQEADIKLADKFRVLMFTITARGMYLYDPSVKEITKIQDGLDWLNSASWAKVKAQIKNE